jgi:membrane fusion protein, multidrug efflux system
MRRAIAILFLPALLWLAACSSAKGDTASDKPPVAVETAVASPGSIEEYVEIVGTLTPKRQADLKSEISGTVEDVYVTEWVRVRKGQPLAKLDTREAKAALLQVEAQAGQAEREYERAVKLKEAGLMTQQGLEAAQTERDAARAMLDLAKTKLDKSVIRAPMDGVVSLKAVNVGDYVENMGANAMFRIVDNSLFDLTATVPSTWIHSVAVGQKLTFTSDAVPDRTFQGTVSFINPAAEADSRAVKVVAVVPNEGGDLKAGLFVKGRILTGNKNGVLQVPRTALLTWDVEAAKADLFVVSGEKAARRSVQTGAVSGDKVEITSGLQSGDVVATRGSFNLRDGDRVAIESESKRD